MLEKGGIQKVLPTRGQFSEQPLPYRKKGWRESLTDKLKKSQQIHPLRAIQFIYFLFIPCLKLTKTYSKIFVYNKIATL